MAAYTYADALTFVGPFIKNIPLTAISVSMSDIINSITYTAYPWRWSLGSLSVEAVANGQQDYTINSSDFWRLVRVRLTKTSDTPDTYRELIVKDHLAPDLTKMSFLAMQYCSYDGALSKLRLERAMQVASGETYTINGEYQKKPTKITATSDAIHAPDHYFPVFVAGMKWLAYDFANDDRAGTAVLVKGGRVQYTGALGIFYRQLQDMVNAEDEGDGTPLSFPYETFGARNVAGFGIYGIR